MHDPKEQVVAALLVQQVVDREAEHGISHTMIRSQTPTIWVSLTFRESDIGDRGPYV
jgi:hypothetical protein